MIGFGIRLECFGLENVACKCFWFGPSRTWLETPPSEKKWIIGGSSLHFWIWKQEHVWLQPLGSQQGSVFDSVGVIFSIGDHWHLEKKKLVMPHNRDIAPARPSSADPQRVVALAAIHRLCGTHSWPHQKWWCLHAAHLSVHSNESRWGISQRGFQP